MTVSSAILQGTGHATCPVISLVCGTAVKAILAYILLGLPGVGMMGAPISTLLCDSLIVICNFTFMVRLLPGILPSAKDFFGALAFPVLAGGGAITLVWLFRRWLGWQAITPAYTFGTVVAVMLLYGLAVLPILRKCHL